eukprot:UN30443
MTKNPFKLIYSLINEPAELKLLIGMRLLESFVGTLWFAIFILIVEELYGWKITDPRFISISFLIVANNIISNVLYTKLENYFSRVPLMTKGVYAILLTRFYVYLYLLVQYY